MSNCIRHLQIPIKDSSDYTTAHHFEPRFDVEEQKTNDGLSTIKKYVYDICVFCGEVKKRNFLEGEDS